MHDFLTNENAGKKGSEIRQMRDKAVTHHIIEVKVM